MSGQVARRYRELVLLSIALGLLSASVIPWRTWRDSASARSDESLPPLPELLHTPVDVPPVTRFRHEVDRASLRQVLEYYQPISPKRNMASCLLALHAVRLWGPSTPLRTSKPSPEKFPFRATLYPPSDLLKVLLDDDAFETMYPMAGALLNPTPHGVFVREAVINNNELPLNVWPDFQPHVDKLLSVLGEIGTPIDTAIRSRTPSDARRDGTVADIVRESLRRFTYTQELEFSAKAYLYYLPPPMAWTTRFGETASVARILERLADRELEAGCCLGIHKHMVFALALRRDDAEHFLTPALRERLAGRLRETRYLLERNQNEDGSWPVNWSAARPRRAGLVTSRPPVVDVLRVVGHHLEWIALAPEPLRPSDACVRKAIRFTIRGLLDVPGGELIRSYAPLSHGARALLLLANADPKSLADESQPDPATSSQESR